MAEAAVLVGIGLMTSLQIAQGSAERSIANEKARNIEKLGQIEAEEARREGRRLRGQQRAALSASGIDPGFGSALAVLNESATEAELMALRRQYRFDVVAADLKQRGKAAQLNSFGSAAGTLLGGIGQAQAAGLFSSGAPGSSAAVSTGGGGPSAAGGLETLFNP